MGEHGRVTQHDPFDPDQARHASEVIRGHVRLAGHRRVSHGLFLPLTTGLSPRAEFLRDLTAWLEVLPRNAAFTHVTAARVLQWQLPALPEQVPVFAAVEGDIPRPQRAGLAYSRLVRPTQCAEMCGLPIDAPEEILLRAARDLGLLDLVILVDSARQAGHVDPRRLEVVLSSHRPGVRMLREAWQLSDHRAASGGETVLRVFHVAMDVTVEPQAVLFDEHGQVVGHADLLVLATGDVHEYDGEVHRDKSRHQVDLRRERGLLSASRHRRGFTLDDLLNHPLTVMHELDRALGRPHRMSRLRRWQRLVENSLYSPLGRDRVLNRWRRINGIMDWSRTA